MKKVLYKIVLYQTKSITGGNYKMIKKLASHLGEYKRSAIVTPLLSALEAIMDILLPTIMAFIIDQGIEKSDMNAILKYGLLTFLVAAFALLLGVLAGRFAADASTGFAGNLRDAMYESIQHYSFSNIDKAKDCSFVSHAVKVPPALSPV